jgi:hypothetical protein
MEDKAGPLLNQCFSCRCHPEEVLAKTGRERITRNNKDQGKVASS